MSKPTRRTLNARIVELNRLIVHETDSINDRRRFTANLRRELMRLVRSVK